MRVCSLHRSIAGTPYPCRDACISHRNDILSLIVSHQKKMLLKATGGCLITRAINLKCSFVELSLQHTKKGIDLGDVV